MATLIQNESSPMLYEGWYGTCPETNENDCSDFALINGSGLSASKIYNEIQAVYIVSSNGQGTLAYDGRQTIPFLINLMPVKSLKCGKSYRIVLKPGTSSINIPEFTYANLSTSDDYRITNDCLSNEEPTQDKLTPVEFAQVDASEESINLGWQLTTVIEDKVSIEISDNENFTNIIDSKIVEETDETSIVSFTGLIEGTKYYARIKSHTSSDGYGDWVETVAKTAISGQNLDVTVSYTDLDKPKLEWNELNYEYKDVAVYRLIEGNFVKIMTINKVDASEFIDNSISEDGTYLYKLNVSNGFYGQFSDVYSVKIDTTPPGVPVPLTQTPTNNKKPTWNWESVEDNVNYEIVLDDVLVTTTPNNSYTATSDLNDGTHTIKVTAIDSFDNKGETGSHQVVIDTTPPNKPNVTYALSLTNNTKPTWNWESDPDANRFGVVFNDEEEIETIATSFTPSEELVDGVYTLKVRAKDFLGNYSEYDEATITIDATPPAKPQFVSDGGLTKNQKPTWEWNAVESAVAYGVILNSNQELIQTETSFTSPVELQDGKHILKVRAKDNVGNWSDYSENEIIVDTTPPGVAKPNTQTPTSNRQPTWTWPDVPTAKNYYVKLFLNESGNPETINIGGNTTFTPNDELPGGSHKLQVWSFDEVGNQSGIAEHIVIIDLDAPEIPQPSTESPTTNKLPTWSWSATSDVKEYGVTLNSSPEIIQTETTFTAPVSLPDGENKLLVRAKDNVGNWSDQGTNIVIIDSTPPDVPNVFSDSNKVTIKRPTWKWDAITQASIYYWKLMEVKSDESLIKNVSSGETTLNVFIPSQDLTDGIYKLEVVAVDALENESEAGSHIIQIKATPPNKPVISADSPTRNRKPTFTFSSDSEDVEEYELQFGSFIPFFTNDTTYRNNDISLPDGEITFKVRAKDSFGNFSEQATKSVEIFSIPDTHDVISVPLDHSGISHRGQLGEADFTLIRFNPGDKFGFNESEFVSTSTISIAILIPGQTSKMMIFERKHPQIGDCVYFVRNSFTYWAKLQQDSNQAYILDFKSDFTQECE